LIQQAIDDFRARRISDLEYLQRVRAIKDAVVRRKSDDLPPSLASNENAAAVFGVVKPYVAHYVADEQTAAAVAAAAAVNIWEIIQRNKKVGFWDDLDAQRRTINDIDDYLYDEIKGVNGIALATEEMDDIIARTMQLARHRIPA